MSARENFLVSPNFFFLKNIACTTGINIKKCCCDRQHGSNIIDYSKISLNTLTFREDLVMARLMIDNQNCTFAGDEETIQHESTLKWGASFAFAAVCMGASVILLHSPRRCSKVLPFYFLVTGLSYVVIGLKQMLEGVLSNQQETALQKTAYCFSGGGTILLLVLGLMMLDVNPKSKSMAKKVTWWFLVCPIFFFMFTAILIGAEVRSGVPLHALASFGLLLFLVCVYMFQIFKDKGKIWHFLAKTLAVFIVTIELFYTKILVIATCDAVNANKNCTTDCTLMDTVHPNGLIHDVVLLFGFAVWAWSEDAAPSIEVAGQLGYPFEGVLDETELDETSLSDGILSSDEGEDRDGRLMTARDEGNDIEVALDGSVVDGHEISNCTSSEGGKLEENDSFHTARCDGESDSGDTSTCSA